MDIIVLLPVLFFSIILHEFAHGWIAYRLGDDTAYLSGRLTLNPLSHIDPIGTIAIPAVCWFLGWPMFGWAKPVPVNALRLPSPRSDMGKVAFAGPAINLILAVVCALFLKIALVAHVYVSQQTFTALAHIFQYGIFINVFLAVFNLIPIPPLDGGRVVVSVLPVRSAAWYEHFIGRYGMWIVIGLILTGLVKYIIFPPTLLLIGVLGKLFGI